MRGRENHLHFGIERAQMVEKGDPVHSGHTDIADDHAGKGGGDGTQRR